MLDYLNTSIHFKPLVNIGGEGKNSIVYTAHDFQLDAVIVVKQIRKTDFKDSSTYFDEAKKLYTSNHPNIVPVQYSCHDADNIYITMPLFQRGSLNQHIDNRILKTSEIVKYSIDFLCGLHHIHTKGLVHLDIKPTNILISNSNDAVLTDFGLAKFLNDEGYTIFDRFYNLHRAPEMLVGNQATHQTDIYQAGLTIYRMCAGNNHFKSQLNNFKSADGNFDITKYESAISKAKFPDRKALPLHIPQKLKNCIYRAIAVDPAERYNSVIHMLNDLAGIEIQHDWQLTYTNNQPKWECCSEDKKYVITLTNINENSCNLSTTKIVLASGNERNIAAYCSKNITMETAYKMVKEALHNNSL